MRNLLSANFLRLRKSMLFWGCLILMLLLGAGFSLYCFLDRRTYETFGVGYVSNLDPVLFRYALLVGILMAVFVPLFFGMEYSDGAIRNKLVVGHSRLSIYFANLITAVAAALVFCAAYFLAALAAGLALALPLQLGAAQIALLVLSSLALVAAFSALYTFVAMLCARKAGSAVACIMGVFLLLFAATYIDGRLKAPEFIPNYELSMNGQVSQSEPEPNPHYLRGAEREVYQFLNNFLPCCQASQYTSMDVADPALLAAYSLGILVVSAGAGAALFQRKDLK